MRVAPAPLTLCRLTACCYVGTLVLAGSVALVGLCAFLIDLAVQLTRGTFASIAF